MEQRLFNRLQNIVRERKQHCPTSSMLVAFCAEYELGYVSGKVIRFTHQELDEIERLLGQCTSQNPLVVSPGDTRMDTAETFDEEKWAKKGVFERLITLARPGNLPISLLSGEKLFTPRGISVNISAEIMQCGIRDDSPIVIVENGSMMTHWHDWCEFLPHICRDATLVYRGHGSNQKALQQCLAAMSGKKKVYAYYDFDLAGVIMMSRLYEEYNVVPIVPTDWQTLHKQLVPNGPLKNKPQVFEKQFNEYGISRKPSNPELASVYSYLVDKRLAITQEHLTVASVPLEMVRT